MNLNKYYDKELNREVYFIDKMWNKHFIEEKKGGSLDDIFTLNNKGAACLIARKMIKLKHNKDNPEFKKYIDSLNKKYKLNADDRAFLESL